MTVYQHTATSPFTHPYHGLQPPHSFLCINSLTHSFKFSFSFSGSSLAAHQRSRNAIVVCATHLGVRTASASSFCFLDDEGHHFSNPCASSYRVLKIYICFSWFINALYIFFVFIQYIQYALSYSFWRWNTIVGIFFFGFRVHPFSLASGH